MENTYRFHDEALSALDKMQDPASGPPPVTTRGPLSTTESSTEGPKTPAEVNPPNPHNCDCDKECHELHDDRLPKEIQVSNKHAEINLLH